jgi:hypothetical protein
MSIMDRYRRNIKQIEDAGKCPHAYFTAKAIEELSELIQVLAKSLTSELDMDKLNEELAHAQTGIEYIVRLKFMSRNKILKNMNYGLDRGYERGVD